MQSHANRYLCCFQELWCDIVWTCGSAISRFPDRLLDLLEGWCVLAYIVCRDSVYSRDVKFWALSSRCMIQDLLVVLKHFIHNGTECPVVLADWHCASSCTQDDNYYDSLDYRSPPLCDALSYFFQI